VKAELYTSIIDEALQKKKEDLLAKAYEKIDRFIEGLKQLDASGKLDAQNVMRLLRPATAQPVAPGPASVAAGDMVRVEMRLPDGNQIRLLPVHAEVRTEQQLERRESEMATRAETREPEAVVSVARQEMRVLNAAAVREMVATELAQLAETMPVWNEARFPTLVEAKAEIIRLALKLPEVQFKAMPADADGLVEYQIVNAQSHLVKLRMQMIQSSTRSDSEWDQLWRRDQVYDYIRALVQHINWDLQAMNEDTPERQQTIQVVSQLANLARWVMLGAVTEGDPTESRVTERAGYVAGVFNETPIELAEVTTLPAMTATISPAAGEPAQKQHWEALRGWAQDAVAQADWLWDQRNKFLTWYPKRNDQPSPVNLLPLKGMVDQGVQNIAELEADFKSLPEVKIDRFLQEITQQQRRNDGDIDNALIRLFYLINILEGGNNITAADRVAAAKLLVPAVNTLLANLTAKALNFVWDTERFTKPFEQAVDVPQDIFDQFRYLKFYMDPVTRYTANPSLLPHMTSIYVSLLGLMRLIPRLALILADESPDSPLQPDMVRAFLTLQTQAVDLQGMGYHFHGACPLLYELWSNLFPADKYEFRRGDGYYRIYFESAIAEMLDAGLYALYGPQMTVARSELRQGEAAVRSEARSFKQIAAKVALAAALVGVLPLPYFAISSAVHQSRNWAAAVQALAENPDYRRTVLIASESVLPSNEPIHRDDETMMRSLKLAMDSLLIKKETHGVRQTVQIFDYHYADPVAAQVHLQVALKRWQDVLTVGLAESPEGKPEMPAGPEGSAFARLKDVIQSRSRKEGPSEGAS
jgi:hypothetical protein